MIQRDLEDFYVYVLVRPEQEVPFYIGKGRKQRMYRHEYHARSHPDCKHRTCRIIRKHWRNNQQISKFKVQENLTEIAAFDLEKRLIAFGRFLGWPLVNLTDGGEGMSGYCHTPEVQARINEARRKYNATPEAKKAASEWGKKMWSDPDMRKRKLDFMSTPAFQVSRLEGAKKTKNAKTYPGFIAPDGTVHENVHNLSKFCAHHGLTISCMLDLAQGKLSQHKGWKNIDSTIWKSKPRYQKAGFISPEGVIYEDIPNLNAFCREHDLIAVCMSKVGKRLAISHRGWKCHPPLDKPYIKERSKIQPLRHSYHGPCLQGPDGTIYQPEEIYNLKHFCAQHHLDGSTMSSVIYGKSLQHKGWIVYPPIPPKPVKPTFTGPGFVSPDGVTYTHIDSLVAFCKEHSLNSDAMSHVNTGRAPHHRGWTRYNA